MATGISRVQGPSRPLDAGRPSPLLLGLFVLLGISILGLCVAFFVLSLTRPYIGAELKLSSGQWHVESLDPSGLAHEKGVEPGDSVIEVNGQPVDEFARKYLHPDLIRQKAVHELVVVNGTGREKSVSASGSALPRASLFESISLFLSAVMFCLVGFFVFLTKPEKSEALLLYLLCLAVALALVSGLASERNITGTLALSIIASAVFPWLSVHFFMIFPVRKQFLTRKPFVAYTLYLPAVIVLLLYALFGRAAGEEPKLWLRSILLVVEFLGLLVCLALIVHSYLTSTYVRVKQQIKIVGLGTTFAILPFVLLSVVPDITKGESLVAPQFPVLCTVFVPVSIGYALVKYQLMDIDLVIRRGLVYGSLLLAMVACYLFLGFGLFSLLSSAGRTAKLLGLAGLASLALVSFRPVVDKLALFLDRALFKDRYDYRSTVASLSAILSAASDLDEVGNVLTRTVSQVLAVRGACLLLSTEGGELTVQSAYGSEYESESKQAILRESASFSNEDDQFPHQAPSGSGAVFLVPLMARHKRVGILCLDGKASRTNFTAEDVSFLHTLSGQVGVVIDNAFLLKQAREREEQLRESEKLYATMAHSSQVSIFIVQDNKFVFVNPQFQEESGFTEEELLGSDPIRIVHPDDRDMVREEAVRMSKGELSSPYEYSSVTKTGEARIVMETVDSIQFKGKRASLGCRLDITERKQVEETLKQRNKELAALDTVARSLSRAMKREEVLQTALDSTLDAIGLSAGGIYQLDEDAGEMRLVAHKGISEEFAAAVCKPDVGASITGQVVQTGKAIVATNIPQDERVTSDMRQTAEREDVRSVVGVPISATGKSLGALIAASRDRRDFPADEIRLLETIGGEIGVAIENAQLFDKMTTLSVTDELTGLYNRRHFYERLETEMYRTQRYGQPFSLAIADLDGFKEYNDKFGHSSGDIVLRSFAQTLKSSLRKTDLVFRYGGDEFTIILSATDANRAKKVLDRIRSKWLETPKTRYVALETPLGFSAGISQFPENAQTADGLVFLADTALYRSKREGGYKSTTISDMGALAPGILDRATLDQIYALAATVDAKDPHTYGHSKRVRTIAEMIAKAIGLSTEELTKLQAAALLHDIGKVGIPDSVLTKPDKPTEGEWKLIREHCAEGSRIVSYIKELTELVPMIRHHHEWYDGTGYPDGLKGEDIPLGARILSVADAYDTMTTPRPYREIVSPQEACGELRRCSGTQFDPKLVGAFIQAINQVA